MSRRPGVLTERGETLCRRFLVFILLTLSLVLVALLSPSSSHEEVKTPEARIVEPLPEKVHLPLEFIDLVAPRKCLGVAAVRDFLSGRDQKLYHQVIEAIHWQESREGHDPNWRVPGPDGELGEYRVTPLWIRDIKRLFNTDVDPFDKPTVVLCIELWLRYYAPRYGAKTPEDMCEMYRLGPTGYREWRQHNE